MATTDESKHAPEWVTLLDSLTSLGRIARLVATDPAAVAAVAARMEQVRSRLRAIPVVEKPNDGPAKAA